MRRVAQLGVAACLASALVTVASGWQAVADAAPPPTVVNGTAQIVRGGVRVDVAKLAPSTPDGARQSSPYMPFRPAERAASPDAHSGSVAALATAEQKEPLAPSPPATGFLALGDNDTSIPPDTHGAVGPADVVTTLNTEVRLQDKVGSVVNTVTLASFWNGLTPAPNPFDPKVVYDPLAGRFVFTAMADARSATSRVLIGVSDSSSASAWHVFGVDADPTNANWADFPSIGFDGNRVVVTVNMFDNVLSLFQGARLFVFDKAEAYDNDGVLAVTTLDDPGGRFGGFTLAPPTTLDPGVSTTYLVEDWAGGNGVLRLSTITGTAPNEALTLGVAFPQLPAAWADVGAGGADFAPQAGSVQKIQTNDSRIGNCVLRGGSIWCTHTVFPLSVPARSGVEWFELAPTGAVKQVGRIDDPSGGAFYAFPSLAVNTTNDVLIGYSRFGAGQFASGNYAYRMCGDPLGTMRDDTVLKPGEGPYWKTFSGTRNRWGDYSHSVVDPSDNSTLWTIQEYAAPPVGAPTTPNSGRWSTWWGRVPAPTSGRPAPTNPSASSTSHSSSNWRSDPTVDVSWSGAASGCGIDGYSFSFTSGPTDLPDTVKDVGADVTAATSPPFGNGPAYFHLRTQDRLGVWSDPLHAGPFLVDALAPIDPRLSSPSHRVGRASSTKVVRIAWQGAADFHSGVDGFSFSWDRSAKSVPDGVKDAEETVTRTTSRPFARGRYWFHLRTRDNAGTWTSTVHLGPFVIVSPPCVVPNLKGKTLPKAKAALKARKCAAGKVTRAFSGKVKKGRVIRQSKRAGSRHPANTKVSLTVSKGPKKSQR